MSEVIADNPVSDLVLDIVEGHRLFKEQGGPLDAKFQAGHPESRVLLMAGENASGKSLMVQVLAAFLGLGKIEALQVSMRYRTMPGMHRCFMYSAFGDESNSTGAESLTALEGAMRTAEGRTKPTWLMLDEPDTGLADSYCTPMGQHLAQFGNRMPLNQCQGFVVLTHSRKLVQSMAFHLEKQPHFLCFSDLESDDLMTAWLEDERERSLSDLLSLSTRSMELHRAVQNILDGKK